MKKKKRTSSNQLLEMSFSYYLPVLLSKKNIKVINNNNRTHRKCVRESNIFVFFPT